MNEINIRGALLQVENCRSSLWCNNTFLLFTILLGDRVVRALLGTLLHLQQVSQGHKRFGP